MADACGRKIIDTVDGAPPRGVRKLGPCETVKSTMSQRPPPPPPGFHIKKKQN